MIDISNQMLEDSALDMEGEIRGKATEQVAVKEGAEIRGTVPVIPHKVDEKQEPGFFAKARYRGRVRSGQAFGKLKRFKRVALRCERTKRNFASIVALAPGFVLVESVHTA